MNRAAAAVTLAQVAGAVQVHNGAAPWSAVSQGYVLTQGDEIKTGRDSRALLVFEDGSKVELGPNSMFVLEEASAQKSSMRFNVGFLKAWVSKGLMRHFTLRTPTAVCSVRGTEFGVSVRPDGATSVELFRGLLAVGDQKGGEVMLKDGQRVDVDARGMGQVTGIKSLATPGAESAGDKLRASMKREVGLDMTKEEVQAAAALEQKNAIYKLGKALVDANGYRVRLEDYIIRPTPNQFKLVVLNERADRFDYFYYLGSFNKTLPDDISGALRQVQGQPFTPPEYFLTGFETGRSNTTDNVLEQASGGHLVDVNNNLVAADAQTSAYDPGTNSVVRLNVPSPGGTGNDPFYTTLFDNYTLKFNGVAHITKILAGGVTPYDGAIAYNPANTTGVRSSSDWSINYVTQLVSPPCMDIDNCTGIPDPNKLHMVAYSESSNGLVWDKFDNYIISDEGKIADLSDFAGLSEGPDFLTMLQKYNYQQIITASEFNGRKIDLVFEPKIMIQSGLIH